MAPKHNLKQQAQPQAKRLKNESESRSSTPADSKLAFNVEYPVFKGNIPSAKELELSGAQFVKSPFIADGRSKDGELDNYYVITPTDKWNSMKKYTNFVIQSEFYTNNQIVFVVRDDIPKKDLVSEDMHNFWVARIMEVRASSPQHVYALVTWLYWPEELPPAVPRAKDQRSASSGQRTYHGQKEVIPSNYMDVLDVLTFAGKADVTHWHEDDDTVPDGMFWRQTYSRAVKLSKLKSRCVCEGHLNPDLGMLICDNSDCGLWIHGTQQPSCLIDDILTKTYQRLVVSLESNGTNGVLRSASKKTKAKPWKNLFKCVIKEEEGQPLKAIITDIRPNANPKSWEEDILCPKCATILRP